MASDKKICNYAKCELGENGGRKSFYGTARAMYCCPKHGTYQRRIDAREALKQANKQQSKAK